VTEVEALRYIEKRGVVLESARVASVPNLANEALGDDRRENWWGHARGKEFFWLTRQIRSNPDVLVCRLVGGKVTYVHRRIWPALARLASVLGTTRLASIREHHTRTGAHRVDRTPFRQWLPSEIRLKAGNLTTLEARQLLAQVGIDTPSAAARRRAS
jgi:hypothetical protein